MKPLLDHTEIAAWADQQEPSKEYHYGNARNCALFRYLDSKDVSIRWVGPGRYKRHDGSLYPIDDALTKSLLSKPWTYGALAARLRAG